MLFGHRLSGFANEWIRTCAHRETIRDRHKLMQVLQQNDLPVYKALLDFQENYGGLSYSFGGPLNQSCTMDVMGRSMTGLELPKTFSQGDQVLVKCLHFIRDGYPMGGYMDGDGKLYLLVYKTLNLIANHVVEFLENEAVKYSLLREQKQWIVKNLYDSEVSAWMANAKQHAIYLSKSSQGYSKWWKSPDSRLYVHIQSNNGVSFKAEAYAVEASDFKQAGFTSMLLLQGFPFSCYYDAERKKAEIEHTKEMYYFNHRCYKTCDYSRVKVTQLKELQELYLYLSGQKDYSVKRLIEEFLTKLPELSIPVDDYDCGLIEYANQNGDGMILKLISYLAKLEDPIQDRRTAAEDRVDRLLFQEYLRRISVFAEEHSMKVHPLYFHPYQAAGLSAEADIEDYSVLSRIKESYAQSICKRTLLYMKYARQGNKVAGRIYRIYEPLLLLFSVGGFIRKEHGFIEVGGGAFYQSSWQAQAAKMPIDIYDRIPEAWKHRNWEYAIDRINRIKWDTKKGDRSNRNDEKLKTSFVRLESELGMAPSKLAPSFVSVDSTASEILLHCAALRRVEGTAAWCICVSYLNWAKRLDQRNPVAMKNPCLYEPFIELLHEEDQIELWETRTMDLIQYMNKAPIMNYADVLRNTY